MREARTSGAIRAGVMALIGCAVATHSVAQTKLSHTVLLRSGDALPAFGPGVTFGGLTGGSPSVGSQGHVALEGYLSGPGVTSRNNLGLIGLSAGAVHNYLRSNDPIPGLAPSVVFAGVAAFEIAVSSQGALAFAGHLAGSGVTGQNSLAMLSSNGSAVRVLARTGDTVPGRTLVYRDLRFGAAIDSAGRVAFRTNFGDENHPGILFNSGATTQLVAATGDSVPASTPPRAFGSTLTRPALSETGRVAFSGTIASPVVSAIFAGEAPSVLAASLGGTQAPGEPAGRNFFAQHSVAVSRSGNAVFAGDTATVQNPAALRSGVWKIDTSGTVTQVASGATPVPGSPLGATVRLHSVPAINSRGEVLFEQTLHDTGGITFNNDQSFCLERDGVSQIVFQEGSLVDDVSGPITAINLLTQLNERSQFAFRATISGAPSNSNRALLAWDPILGAIKVHQTGDLFTHEGVTKVIQNINITGLTASGGGSSLSDRGELVYGLAFTDGSVAIVSTVIPSPAAGSLFALGVAAALRRTRRTRD